MSKRVLLATALILSTLAARPSFSADADPVVARVNGTEIHRSEVDTALQAMGPQAQQIPPQMLYPNILDHLIVTKLVAEKGYAEKLQNEKAVKDRLKQDEAQIVAEEYVRHTVTPMITEAKIKAKYDELAAKYKPVDEVRARHILIKVKPDATPDEVAKAEQKAEDIIKQLKGGADFAKLASEVSEDPGSAKQGGDLGYFPHDAMVPSFADAAFAMKSGEISDKPVKTNFGFHVIKIEDRRKSAAPPLADVHDKIVNQIGQEMTAELVKNIREKAKIEKFNLDGSPMQATPTSAPAASSK